jgi:low temperature requirement protein LtrA
MRLSRGPLQPARAPGADEPVTSLELFFDLVFVFAITQLTGLLLTSDGLEGYGHAALVLGLTWWMYDGYAWLTNNVGPTSASTRLPILAAMAGFLVMAIVTPDAFGSGRWLFALAYLLVVVIHGLSFARSALGGSARAIIGILPVNLSVALLLLVAALLPGQLRWLAWLGGVLVLVLSIATRRESGFTLRADHFAERHQLVIIIALGETVVAIGAGGQRHLTHLPILATVVLSLVLIAALWWVYFGLDSDRGLQAMGRAGDGATTLAIWGYSVSHLLHVAGLVMLAAGLHVAVHEPGQHLGSKMAVTMSAGAALFLLGEVLFERWLTLGSGRSLGIGAAGCVIPAAAGLVAPALAELVLLTTVAVGLVVVRETIDDGRDGVGTATTAR